MCLASNATGYLDISSPDFQRYSQFAKNLAARSSLESVTKALDIVQKCRDEENQEIWKHTRYGEHDERTPNGWLRAVPQTRRYHKDDGLVTILKEEKARKLALQQKRNFTSGIMSLFKSLSSRKAKDTALSSLRPEEVRSGNTRSLLL